MPVWRYLELLPVKIFFSGTSLSVVLQLLLALSNR